MLLDKYEQEGLLFTMNFKEKAKSSDAVGYRGELVLVKGEVADANGRCKPPVALVRSAVVLEKDGKLDLVSGFLDELEQINTFLDVYKADFSPNMKALFFVVNLTKPVQVEIEGINFIFVPLTDGVTWNELIDELAMEKSDFKGQSSGDKVATMADALGDYKPKYETVSLEDAFGLTAEIKRELRGAV